MTTLVDGAVERAREVFYRAGGPWWRCQAFEALGSRRYSRPALFGMDEKLAQLMPWHGGTFVEAGAHDGYTQSNTYYLERHRGWSGLLIEPIPVLRKRCERRRGNSHVVGCALVAPESEGNTAVMQFRDLMSVIDGDETPRRGEAEPHGYSVEVPARTLSSVLDEANLPNPDLLVLDLEGHELDALAGLDRDAYAPLYILLESLDRAVQEPEFDAVLSPHYERVGALSEYDLLYRRRDRAVPR